MEELVANVDHIKFDLEISLETQLGCQPLPFAGMDKSCAAVCTFFMKSICNKGAFCPFRHTKGEKSVVCKHWLRGLCKKGDQCEFLHEYDMSKMPECYFYSKFGECSNKECQYLHIDPESKIKDCPWYDRGFCKHGPHCRNRHARRVMCINYLCGFCLDGKQCKFVHPSFDLPVKEDYEVKRTVICHACGQPGHKSNVCPNINREAQMIRSSGAAPGPNGTQAEGGINITVSAGSIPTVQGSQPIPSTTSNHQFPYRRPLDQVTCFKCGDRGHYANKCPKSMKDLLG